MKPGLEDGDTIGQESRIINILDMCNRKLDEYISRRAEIWQNMDNLIERLRRYNIAHDNYLHKENIFSRDEVISAVPSKRIKMPKGVNLQQVETDENVVQGEELTGALENEPKKETVTELIHDITGTEDTASFAETDGMLINTLEGEKTESELKPKELPETMETVDAQKKALEQLPKEQEGLGVPAEEPAKVIEHTIEEVMDGTEQAPKADDEPKDDLDAWIEKIAKAGKPKVAADNLDTGTVILSETEGMSLEMLEEQKMRRLLLDSIKVSQQELSELRERLSKFGVEGEK